MRIEDYGLIGDTETAALVGRDGSIDWLCLPRFDSPACFAGLLDDETAGRWLIAPVTGGPCTRRSYRGDTLVLDSGWDTGEGTVRVTDAMPVRGEAPDVVRLVHGVSGRVRMRSELRLRFDYGQVLPWVTHHEAADGGHELRRGRRPGRGVRAFPGRARRSRARRRVAAGGGVHRRRRRDRAVRAHPRRLAPATAPLAGRGRCGARHRAALGGLDQRLPVRRWRSPHRQRGAPLAADAQGVDLRAHRRDRRGGHDLAARAAEAARATGTTATAGCATPPSPCRRCWARATSPRRGPGGSGCCGRSPATPPTCRSCTRSTARGGCRSTSWTGCRLRGRPAGAGRQRRGRAVPARRVGRGARRVCTWRAPAGSGTLEPAWEHAAGAARLPGGQLAEPGRRAVGDARRPARHFVHSKVMAWAGR